MSFRIGDTVKDVIRQVHADPSRWTAAVRADGSERDGAAVAELTGLVDLGAWPAGARLLVRASRCIPEPSRPSTTSNGYRFTAVLTDQPDADLAGLDLRHRGHARVEQRIRNLKDTGWGKLPSADYAINGVWLQLATLAADLLTWFAAVCLDGPLKVAEPKTVRYRCCTPPPASPNTAAKRGCTSTAAGRGPPSWSPRSSGCAPSPPPCHNRQTRDP